MHQALSYDSIAQKVPYPCVKSTRTPTAHPAHKKTERDAGESQLKRHTSKRLRTTNEHVVVTHLPPRQTGFVTPRVPGLNLPLRLRRPLEERTVRVSKRGDMQYVQEARTLLMYPSQLSSSATSGAAEEEEAAPPLAAGPEPPAWRI